MASKVLQEDPTVAFRDSVTPAAAVTLRGRFQTTCPARARPECVSVGLGVGMVV